MGDYVWLKSYPAGIPAEITLPPFASLPEMLTEMIREFGPRPAFHNLGKALSFDDLDRLSRDFAAFLHTLRALSSEPITTC